MDKGPRYPARAFLLAAERRGLRFIAQVIELRRNGVIQRLSERLTHSPAITSVASSYRAHRAWHFVAIAHLSTDQVNYWNKYSDTVVHHRHSVCAIAAVNNARSWRVPAVRM